MTERAADDVELTKLPPARRPLKAVTLAVMALTAALALWLAYGLRSEASFALEGHRAVDLGALAAAGLAAHEGGFVRARVDLANKPTVSFSRPLEKVGYRATLVSPERWVVYPVARAMEGPRFQPPSLVAGRLVHLSDLGVRFRGLEDRLAPLGAASDAWVLVDGEDPTNMGWVLAFEVLLLAFAAFNLASIVRLARRVR